MSVVAKKRRHVAGESRAPERGASPFAPVGGARSRATSSERSSDLGDAKEGGKGKRLAGDQPPFAATLAERILGAAFFGSLVAGTLVPSEAVQYGVALPLATIHALIFSGWLALSAATGRRVPIGVVGLGVGTLALWTAISAAVVVFGETGDRRAAVTMAAQWIGYAALLLAGLGLARGETFRRYAIIFVGAAAAAWAAMGVYDYYVRLPGMAQWYFDLPEDQKLQLLVMELGGNVYDETARKRFEDRLLSVEPLTTFALTNSLAAFLLPGWIFATYGALRQAFRQTDRRSLVAWALVWLVASFVLFLTKSRTAWGAAALGGGALILLFLVREKRLPWKIVAGGLVGLVALAGVAWATGAFDSQILTEAVRSFSYRLEYWRATAGIVAERPLFGTGPGNFASYYLHEKLPRTSEEVKDPHQWLLEIASTVGVPGALALSVAFVWAVALGLVAWFGRSEKGSEETGEPEDSMRLGSEESFVARRPFAMYDLGVAMGAVVGFMLIVLALIPPEFAMFAVGVVAFALVRWGLGRMRLEVGELAGLAALATATLLVHLSATGGIGYPGILPWLFLAAALAASARPPRLQLGRIASLAVAFAFAFVACTTQFWAVPPTLSTGPSLSAAEEAARSLAQGFIPQAEREALQALVLDPYLAATKDALPPPTETLVDARWALFMHQPNEQRLNAVLAAEEEAIRRDPASSRTYRFLADRMFAAGVALDRDDLLERAVGRYRQAVERYPNASALRAQLAAALAAAGQREEAEQAIAEAERLDPGDTHLDQRLERQIIVDPSSPTGNSTVGEWLARFRASGGDSAETAAPRAN